MPSSRLTGIRLRAAAVSALIVAAALVVAIGGVVAITGFVGDVWGALTVLLVVVAVHVVIAVSVATALRRSHALRRVQEGHPGDLVFLAKRQLAVVSDLSIFLGSRGLSAIEGEVANRWSVALLDARGMSAWSVSPNPRELLLIEWETIADVSMATTTTMEGRRTCTVEVDVKPFLTPLNVVVGYAAWIVTMPMIRSEVAEVVELCNAIRSSAREPEPRAGGTAARAGS